MLLIGELTRGGWIVTITGTYVEIGYGTDMGTRRRHDGSPKSIARAIERVASVVIR